MSRLMGSLAAEVLKLRKRRATWALGVLLVLSMAVGHYFAYSAWLASLESGAPERVAVTRWWLLPENAAPLVVDTVGFIAGPIALILGALVGGSEYGWNTLKTILTRRAGRAGVLLGKGLALGVLLAAVVPAIFAAGFCLSLLTAGTIDAARRTPEAWPLLGAMVAAWLILAAWGMVGLALGVVSRGTTLAVGLGLVYALAIEFAIRGIVSAEQGLMANVRDALIGANASALARSFVPDVVAEAPVEIGSGRAVLTLIGYIIGSLWVAWIVFQQRDIQ